MAFSMMCPVKGCGLQMDPYIDPKTDKVYCSACDNEINNITYFTKVQLKSLKQYKQKSTTSFAIKCSFCNKEDRPKLLNNTIVCSICNKELKNLSEPFKLMLKDQLKKI